MNTGKNYSSKFYVLLLACFFVSGFTGLIYEILWTRMIVKLIGSAPFSVSIVLTVFMGGLGLGSYLVGKRIDTIKNPLRLVQIYGALELVIAAYGLLLPFILMAVKPLFSILYNEFYQYFWVYNLITFFGCSILLIIPVICMGATLPVLCRFFVTNINTVGKHIGRLYGLNTIGAACGSLICGFFLINLLGVWGTLMVAVVLNICIAIPCLNVSVIQTSPSSDVEPSSGSGNRDHDYPNTEENKHIVTLALFIFAVSGFAAMAYEVVWIKLLGLIIGPTTYSFTIVLVTFISCLALGSLFFGRWADKVKDSMYLLVMTQIFAALSALLVSQLLGNSQFFFSKLIFQFKDSFATLQIIQAAFLFLFMFIPTFCLGATFPLVGKICTQSLVKTGRTIGSAYAVNTVGAVLGSFSAGFILIPFLGKENSVRFVASIQLFVPIIISLFLYNNKKETMKKWLPLYGIIGTCLICLALYPSWDRTLISRGTYERPKKLKGVEMGWVESLLHGTEIMSSKYDDELIYYGDGIGGFTTVTKGSPNIFGEQKYSLINSGKADASSSQYDMPTQVLSAHFPMMFHENPKDVLVLGLASGITSGEILHYPIEKLDTIEINQQVVEASNFFIPWNNNILEHPKTNLIIQDGRAHLELTNQTYDVIISEPSNPWMAGLASLFTREFMKLAKDRLNKNGIYVQWVHSYQMDWDTFSLIGRTFKDVFPNSLIASTDPRSIGPDFLLVGFAGDYNLNPEIAEIKLKYAKKSKNMNLLDSSLVFRHIMSEDLSKMFSDGALNTDNYPILEFSAPKLVHSYESSIKISSEIKKRIWLRYVTRNILAEHRTNTNKQIDYIAYLLSYGTTYQDMDAVFNMSPGQKEELDKHFMACCREIPFNSFEFIKDPNLRKNCIREVIGAVDPSKYSDRAKLYFYLGVNCMKNNMYDEAMTFFSETININPYNGDAHFNIGFLSFHKQNYPLAISHFNEVLKIRQNDSLTKEYLGKIDTALSKIDDRIQALEKDAEKQADNHLAYHSIAKLYHQKGDLKNAIVFNNKALAIQPDFFNALQHLAYIHAFNNENAKSIEYFKHMVSLKPSISPLYYNIACLYSKQKQIENSIDWLQQAINKGFNNWSQIETDKDLANIRTTKAFSELKAKYNNPVKNKGDLSCRTPDYSGGAYNNQVSIVF